MNTYYNVFHVSCSKKNENLYHKLNPSGSAPGCIYGTPEMHKFPPSDIFPKVGAIVSSIGTFDCDIVRFLVIFFHP